MDKNLLSANNRVEFVNLDALDYEYLIEQFTIDINKFEFKTEPESKVEAVGKKKKENASGKQKDSGKNKQKGKKKKNADKDDLALSKESSKLSIYSTKASKPVTKLSAQPGQKLKVTVGGGKSGLKNMNINLLMEKAKIPAEVKKLIKEEFEEIVDTTPEEVSVPVSTTSESTKKKKKEKKTATAPNVTKAETKAPVKEKEKEDIQNRRVEDFLKTVKEKKNITQGPVKYEEKLSIKTNFLDKHKYLFSLDPSQRLRLRDLATLTKETIDNFFKTLTQVMECFLRICKDKLKDKDEDYIKLNVKDASIFLDNLSEICLNLNKPELLTSIIESSLNVICNVLLGIKSNSNAYLNSQFKILLLNILYTIHKYQNEATLTISSVIEDKLLAIHKDLSNSLASYLTSPQLGKNLKEDDEVLFSFLAISVITIILKKIDSDFILDQNMRTLLQKLDQQRQHLDKEQNFQDFFNFYNNIRFFTKFSHLFDLNKSKLYVLSIKASRALEASLVEIQNLLIKSNEKFFSKIISSILLVYIQNFSEFFEIQENLYDDIFNLLKYLCEDKVFTSENIKAEFLDSKGQATIRISESALQSDEMISKYISLLIKFIKYFEKVFFTEPDKNNFKEKKKAEDAEIYIFIEYFHEVLSIVLNLKQGYLRDKYIKFMEKTIEGHLDDPIIADRIFLHITDVIRKGLMSNLNSNLIHSIKNLKDLIKFYTNYDQIKKNILKLFDMEIKSELEFSLFTIFYLSFLNINKPEDLKLLHNLIQNSSNFIENILFIDRKLCFYLTKYYIDEEINSMDGIINIIFDELKHNNTSLDILVNYILSYSEKVLVYEINMKTKVNNVNMIINILEKFIAKGLFDLEKFASFVTQFVSISVKSENSFLVNTILIYFINKVSSWDTNLNLKREGVIDSVKEQMKKSSVFMSNVNHLNILNEVTLINDNIKKINAKEYLKSFDQLLPVVFELVSLERVLRENPDYFKVDNIEVENMAIEEQGVGESVNKASESISNINTSIASKNIINLDLILHIFNNYLTLIESLFSAKSKIASDEILFNIINFQDTINHILSNNTIFSNLITNKSLLEAFIKQYLKLKEKTFELGQNSLKELRRIELDSKKDSGSDYLLSNKDLIAQHLVIVELSEKVAVNTGNFVKYRCRDQIVHLFKEHEIYKMFLTKDREFQKMLFDRIDLEYRSTIINEESIKTLIAKAQNEDEDLLEEVVYSIFSKQVIQYLECPEEIIEFLSTMNEALKYDLKVDRKEFYNSLFSYFYVWKTIMSKIENGFKLYTTDKQYVPIIDNYKTLLKFVINYLERNNKLYEMFLLLVVSLIHLIDDERSLEDRDKTHLMNLKEFDDSCLTDKLDNNTFQFLMSVLYKFVKIFPSLVKFYYDESRTKLKNVFKQLNSSIILPNMLMDLKERIHSDNNLLSKYQIKVRDTKSLNYIEFDFNANEEIKFLIEISIPPIFPLKKLDINFKCNAVIDTTKLLHVKMNLNQAMNSSIDNVSDNLIIWAENVRQLVVSGQEPCPVCYSYLHGTDKSLPGSTCKTCKKKFHSLCIKEWFKNLARNGQKFSCPMCRAEWKGR